MKDYTVEPITYNETRPWIMRKHYAKRMPSISYAFGLLKNRRLVGVLTYGKPASNSLCVGVCGERYKDIVFEYNRLCLLDNKKNEASFFTAKTFKLLPKPLIIISYADTNQKHIGYCYQATNWIYTGLSEKRTDRKPIGFEGNKHSRHLIKWGGDLRGTELVDRPQKHRYIYFIGSKKQKKEMKKALRYPILPYPKGKSKRYDASAEFPTQIRLF